MNIVYVGCLVFAGLFLLWASTFGVRSLLKDFAAPLKQPEVSPAPPTGTLRPQRRVALSDPSLSATLSPRRAA